MNYMIPVLVVEVMSTTAVMRPVSERVSMGETVWIAHRHPYHVTKLLLATLKHPLKKPIEKSGARAITQSAVTWSD
jgi:hypothetical protein